MEIYKKVEVDANKIVKEQVKEVHKLVIDTPGHHGAECNHKKISELVVQYDGCLYKLSIQTTPYCEGSEEPVLFLN